MGNHLLGFWGGLQLPLQVFFLYKLAGHLQGIYRASTGDLAMACRGLAAPGMGKYLENFRNSSADARKIITPR